MNELVKLSEIESKILEIRGQQVILDKDVAELYGIETRAINQAVSNNPEKFPNGYIVELDKTEWENLKSKFLTSSWGGTRKLPKAFTEKGLYMLATILKSPKATETTLAIIETFAKVRELTRVLHNQPEEMDENQQGALMKTTSKILADVIDINSMEVTGDETTLEFSLAFAKFKRTVKREKRKK